MRKAIIPLVATAAAQLLVIGSIAAAFAFQPETAQLPTATIPVRADIEQGECIRQDPAPYESITYHVPLDIAHFEYINGFEKTLYWTADQMMAHADKYSPAFSATAYKKLLNGEIPQEDMWKYSSFWYRNFDGMAKKTMLRQLISKWGIMTVEMTTAYERDGRVMVPNSADDGLLPETPDFADAGQNGLSEQDPPKIERTAKTMDLPEPEADEVKAAVDLATL